MPKMSPVQMRLVRDFGMHVTKDDWSCKAATPARGFNTPLGLSATTADLQILPGVR